MGMIKYEVLYMELVCHYLQMYIQYVLLLCNVKVHRFTLS